MKRPAIALAAVLALGSARAEAQVPMSIYFDLGQDSALALVPGIPASVTLSLYTYYPQTLSCYGLSAYSITLQFDPAALQDPTATAVPFSGFGPPTVTNRAGAMDLAGSGSSSSCVDTPAQVRFTLLPAAAQGATVSIQANALTDYLARPGLEALMSTVTLRVCHASKMWGDFDANLAIDSRDALIALTAAVGLPVAGFDTSVGDVDRDGGVTSRDALYILSAGLGSATGTRVGKGVADGCPASVPVPPAHASRRGAP